MDRDVAGRAVAVAGERQIVERGRLIPGRLRSAGLRVAGEAELVDARPDQLLRVGRAVRLVAGEAVAGRAGDVVEHERPALLRVAGEAGELAVHRELDRLPLAIVGIVAVDAGHAALVQPVRVRLVAEGGGDAGVAGLAERSGFLRQEVLGARAGRMDRVAGEAVDRGRVRVEPEGEGAVGVRLGMAGEAVLGALEPVEGLDQLGIAARLDVRRAVTVAGRAGLLRIRRLPVRARVRIAGEAP